MEKLNYDTVILGGTLEALIYSFHNNVPIILLNPKIPPASELTKSGLSKKLLWERLSFILSFAGLNPCSQKISSYRLEDNNILKLFGKIPYSYTIFYKKLINFETQNEHDKYVVVDNFKILNLSYKLMHVFDEINTNDKFINNIRIFPMRNNMRGSATSKLTVDELRNDDYNETYARLKIEDLIKQNGMTGKYIGTIKEPIFKPVKVELLNRELYQINEAEDDLIDKRLLPTNKYLLKYLKIFGNPYDP